MIGVSVLGATGSIGQNTLDVLTRHPDKYEIVAITANTEVDGLYDQCIKLRPRFAVMADDNAAEQLQAKLGTHENSVTVLSGPEGLCQVASLPEIDYVMAAIVGAAGLKPTLEAVRHGKRIMLANKESLVMSGDLFMSEVKKHQAELLPIDSEHNAIFQCMPQDAKRGFNKEGVRKILLTGSGGPFRTLPVGKLAAVTPKQACKHPNWVMGKKISVDSATMMNKGLELIEACWLFEISPDNIQIVVHPQSVIHSMVEYVDGSILAQLGSPDMRIPIAHALAWPQRMYSGVEPISMFDVCQLDFERPDPGKFRCLDLAYQAVKAGGTAPAILNAANEVAVSSFLESRLTFPNISNVIENVLVELNSRDATTLDVVLEDDQNARRLAEKFVLDLSESMQ
ncbi:MAG: 1-deoxy-D-xylulose-5-phosphate reductoisomerase [Gammaproteobacteria bacterium]